MNAHSNFVTFTNAHPRLEGYEYHVYEGGVAAHAAAAVALTPEGATPAVAASAQLIGATAVAPAPLGSAPVLCMLTPAVRVIVVVISLDIRSQEL